ncbi:MAG: hypothetical protein ABL919_15715, partial [Methylococcales bacterium]
MNNKEHVSQAKSTSENIIDNRRLFIKGAGIAAPVVLTLSSRSVLGAATQCVSQILSGNISNAANASCEVGTALAVWANSVSLNAIPVSPATVDRSKQTARGETCAQSVSRELNENSST